MAGVDGAAWHVVLIWKSHRSPLCFTCITENESADDNRGCSFLPLWKCDIWCSSGCQTAELLPV